MKVVESDDVVQYLMRRNLLSQYQKAKRYIEEGNFFGVQLKKRQPKSIGRWYFRINQQYRALCARKGDILVVIEIDDHQ